MFVFLDTPFDPDFPIYTRANAGEILPAPVTPLGWSVLGPGMEEGFRVSFCDDFSLVPRPGPDRPFQMTGRFAARFHLNLSVIRTTAQRLPGTSADVIDVQYFGDAAAHGLPAHTAHPDDRRYRVKAPAALGRTLAGIGRRVDRGRAAADDFGVEVATAIADGATDADLVRLLRRGSAIFGGLLGDHVTARALTSPILEQARGALVRAGVAEEDALRFVSDIPDLESAKPSRSLADIARTVPAGSELHTLVGRGSYEALASSSVPGAADLHARLAGFLEAYGHRGVGEFDPTNPAWEQRPDDVVRLLGRLGREAPPAMEVPDIDPGRVARPLVAAARAAMARAERTKDNAMRGINQLRRILFALGGRWSDHVDDELFRMLTLVELEAAAHGAGFPTVADLERRASAFRAASAITPAEWSDGDLRVEEPAPAGADGPLTGIAGSPGVAEGRVRVLADPYDDFDDGDVLVAHMTDTAWTPLFLAASAVVTDVGGVLSHATIVARDLGIPAVVNTKTATSALTPGTRVRVDGTAGTVVVVDA